MTQKELLLQELIDRDDTGHLKNIHDQLVSSGLKFDNSGQTLLYKIGKEARAALRVVGSSGKTLSEFSFPKNYWENNNKMLGHMMSMVGAEHHLSTGEHPGMQSAGRIKICDQTIQIINSEFISNVSGGSRSVTKILNIKDIAEELNRLSESRSIGALQDIRRELKGFHRRATRSIFGAMSIKEDFAFHLGGRTELQFNVGFETIRGIERFRHGVAFSLETTQTLPTIDPLIPKIAKFNEFVRTYPDELARFRMWHYASNSRSGSYGVGEIPPELVQPHTFIFLGHLSPTNVPDYERVLDDFDTLLALYRFVEGNERFPSLTQGSGPRFSPGCSVKASSTMASLPERTLDISLRHNTIQLVLYEFLVKKYGYDSVGTEIPGGAGTRLDVVLKVGGKFDIYEIKTAQSARACIREALAQLLEYSYWPGTQEAERLIVVGEPEIDDDCRQFLSILKRRFSLPIYYAQINLKTNDLVESAS